MPIDRFSTTYAVDAPPAEVWAHLADPHSYVGLSPLVVTVRDVRPVHDDGREAVEYVAVERFRWGPLRWDNPIRVTMTTPSGRRIVSTVVSPGAVRLESTVDLAEHGSGTEVTEVTEVRSPGPLRRFVTGKARSVQTERARELTRRMSRT
jgi:carbon monoxide dehydrogenase subunit G